MNRYRNIIFLVLLALTKPATAACNISTLPINFGNYDVFSTVPLDSTSTLTVSCDQRVRVEMAIGTSTHSGVFDPRQMKHITGSDLLNYNLYTRANRNRIWGDGSGNTRTLRRRVRPNRPLNATVYGRITASQDVSVGQYTDTLVITVIF